MTEDNKKILCPDCGAEIIKTEEMMVGDIVECQECGTEVEILSLEPLQYRELVEEK
ncbi:MAG: lysine biosynthesis protein LysW [Candidatus Shapirobacteria bacterium]